MPALDRKALDAHDSLCPGCGTDHNRFKLVGACHPEAGSTVKYLKPLGELLISCHRCGREIARIAVAADARKNYAERN